LADAGYGVGVRLLELISFREKSYKRESNIVSILSFIAFTLWKILFGKQADTLEKSNDNQDQCELKIPFNSSDIISDNQPLVAKFISTPKDYSSMSSAAFVAGIIEGILDASDSVSFLVVSVNYFKSLEKLQQ
jgi:hypothetical protein